MEISQELSNKLLKIKEHKKKDADLSNCEIEDSHLGYILNILLSKEEITHLNLKKNNITDQGVCEIAEFIQKHPKVVQLTLYDNDITEESLNYLCAFNKLKKLSVFNKSLRLTDTGKHYLLQNSSIDNLPGIKTKGQDSDGKIQCHLNGNKHLNNPPPDYFLNQGKQISNQLVTETISNLFLEERKLDSRKIRKLIDFENSLFSFEERKGSYLHRSVERKQKLGEENFQEMLVWLLKDLDIIESEARYLRLADSHYEPFLDVLTVIRSLYLHNSSHYPPQGYGKAQQIECENMVFYFRSQTDNPLKKVFNQIVSGGSDYLPRNMIYIKRLSWRDNRDFDDALDTLSFYGKKEKKINNRFNNNFGPSLGYTGARANNIVCFKLAFASLEYDIDSKQIKSSFNEVLKAINHHFNESLSEQYRRLYKALDDERYPRASFKRQINTILDSLNTLSINNKLSYHPYLFSKMMDWRSQKAAGIAKDVESYVKADHYISKIPAISVTHYPLSTFIVIRLYPGLSDKEVYKSENSNQSNLKGLTKVMIGFLGGLINHFASLGGYHVVAQRRPSFGFVGPTLTDLSVMNIRLSLGMEPNIFSSTITYSLMLFNRLLQIFNFTNKQDPLVKACFESIEKGKSTKTRGACYLKTSTRCNKNEWAAVWIASAALEKHHKNVQNSKSMGYLNDALIEYLEEFVLGQPYQTKIREGQLTTEIKNIKYSGYRVPGRSENFYRPTQGQGISSDEKVLFELLSNTALHTTELLSGFSIDSKNPKRILKRTFHHVIWKLYKNIVKTDSLLSNLNEQQHNVTHLYAKACNLLENLLEYSMVFKTMNNMFNDKYPSSVIESIRTTDIEHFSRCVDIDRDRVSVFYADSGQQANVLSILQMDIQHSHELSESKKTRTEVQNVYIFDRSYYELESFFEKVREYFNGTEKEKCVLTKNLFQASIFFVDVTYLDNSSFEDIVRSIGNYENLKSVIIDITNNSALHQIKVKRIIHIFLSSGIRVLLTTSCLKLEELARDKYQLGRIVTLAPAAKNHSKNIKYMRLKKDVSDVFRAVSNEAVNEVNMSYMEIMNQIYQDKVNHTKYVSENDHSVENHQKPATENLVYGSNNNLFFHELDTVNNSKEILNVSGYKNNCGLYALALSCKKAIEFQQNLGLTMTYSSCLEKINDTILKHYLENHFLYFGDQDSVGKKLRMELKEALYSDEIYKLSRVESFVTLAYNYFETGEYSIDMEAWFKGNKEILSYIRAEVDKLKQSLPDQINHVFASILNEKKLANSQRAEESFQFIKSILNKEIQEVESHLRTRWNQFQDYDEVLYECIHIFWAWEYINEEYASIERRREFIGLVHQTYEEITHKGEWLDEVMKFIFLAVPSCAPYSNFNDKSVSQLFQATKENAFNRAFSLILTSKIQSNWDSIYKNYINYVVDENNEVQLSVDELKVLGRRWGVNVCIAYDEENEQISSEFPEGLTVCLTTNAVKNHWLVDLARQKEVLPKYSTDFMSRPGRCFL